MVGLVISYLGLAFLALAPLEAICERCTEVSLVARAGPPAFPPLDAMFFACDAELPCPSGFFMLVPLANVEVNTDCVVLV